jgi:hypothetical protein
MSTVREVFSAAGLQPHGFVRWGTPPELQIPGVYVVATTPELDCASPSLPFVIDRGALRSLRERRPEIAVDGGPATEMALCERLGQMWLASETILYIGLAGTSVRHRVMQYYRTSLGARSPHAGGWPIKVLANLSDLWVHFAPSAEPTGSEIAMIAAFLRGVPREIAAASCDPGNALPYANLVYGWSAKESWHHRSEGSARNQGRSARTRAIGVATSPDLSTTGFHGQDRCDQPRDSGWPPPTGREIGMRGRCRKLAELGGAP